MFFALLVGVIESIFELIKGFNGRLAEEQYASSITQTDCM